MRNTKPPKPAFGDRRIRPATRPFAFHRENPAGSKLLRRFYRAKHGVSATLNESIKWYAALKFKKAAIRTEAATGKAE